MKECITESMGLAPFKIKLTYVDGIAPDPVIDFDDHIHAECEIYLNLSGNVSFMVENRIYPIKSGSVIITRPCEYHHCIYHSDEPHEHIWILFESAGNEAHLPLFFERESGKGNLIELSEKQKDRFRTACFDALKKDKMELSDFFRLMAYLENADSAEYEASENIPSDIAEAIEYIGQNLANPLSVSAVASVMHMSVNTLERRFSQVLHVTPSGYIKSRRLARAAELLPSGKSVGEVCEKCGFQDYSNFIAVFRQKFGMTPLKFKKLYGNL